MSTVKLRLKPDRIFVARPEDGSSDTSVQFDET